MTSWVDLIDTDPVGAYHAWRDSDGYAPFGNRTDFENAMGRLVSNLAALCEHMSYSLAAHVDANLGKRYIAKNEQQMADHAKRQQISIMRHATNTDGSRRFPEVK